jgi:hypothetical protein
VERQNEGALSLPENVMTCRMLPFAFSLRDSTITGSGSKPIRHLVTFDKTARLPDAETVGIS